MKSKPELVVGTGNRAKGRELAELLAPADLKLATLADFPQAINVLENGDTFAANAALKATQQARHLGRWVLADDSGLAVDALAGTPACSPPGTADRQPPTPRITTCSWSGWLRCLRNTHGPLRLPHDLGRPLSAVRAESESYCCGRITSAPGNTGSAMIRCLRSWNTTARSASWAWP